MFGLEQGLVFLSMIHSRFELPDKNILQYIQYCVYIAHFYTECSGVQLTCVYEIHILQTQTLHLFMAG